MTLYHETGERGNGQNIIFKMYSKQKRNFNRIAKKISMFLQLSAFIFKELFPSKKTPLCRGALAVKGQLPRGSCPQSKLTL